MRTILKKTHYNFKESAHKSVNQNNYKPDRICYVCGGKGESFHYARNCPKCIEKDESTFQNNAVSRWKIKSDSAARNELELIELFIDGKKIKCLKDSGSELIIVKKLLFPHKIAKGLVEVRSSFGHVIQAETAKFVFSLCENGKHIQLATSSELIADAISPPPPLSETVE